MNEDYKGLFISLEGLEGCGKTTFAKNIVEHLKELGYDVLHVREPGGTVVGEKLRNIFIEKHDKPENTPVPTAELLIMMASRVQLTETVIKPALRAGTIVVSERYMDSTYALQGFGRDILTEVMTLDNNFLRGFGPDCTFYLDISVQESNRRQDTQGRVRDRFESEGDKYHIRVKEGFDYRHRHDKSKRIIKINAERPIGDIQADINSYLEFALNTKKVENGH